MALLETMWSPERHHDLQGAQLALDLVPDLVLKGPMTSKGDPLALDLGPSLAPEDLSAIDLKPHLAPGASWSLRAPLASGDTVNS